MGKTVQTFFYLEGCYLIRQYSQVAALLGEPAVKFENQVSFVNTLYGFVSNLPSSACQGSTLEKKPWDQLAPKF